MKDWLTSRFLLIIGLVFTFGIPSYSQSPFFKNYSVQDGLPSNYVYSVCQDRHGYIWISTEDGVSRFDGKDFQNYMVADGLGENEIFQIKEDSQGRLWFLSFTGEVSFFQDDQFFNSKNHPLLKQIPPIGIMENYVEDSEGNIWIVARTKHILKISKDLDEFVLTPFKGALSVIYMDSTNQVRVGNLFSVKTIKEEGKLLDFESGQMSKVKEELTKHFYGTEYHESRHWGEYNNKFIQIVNGTLVKSEDGTIPDELTKGDYYTFNTYQSHIFEDQDHNLWVSGNDGVFCFEKGDFNKEPMYHFLKGKKIYRTFQDREGNFWFSSLNEGIFFCTNLKIEAYSINNVLSEKNITTLGKINDHVIFAGKNREVGIWSEKDGITTFPSPFVKKWMDPFPQKMSFFKNITEDKIFWGGLIGFGIAQLSKDGKSLSISKKTEAYHHAKVVELFSENNFMLGSTFAMILYETKDGLSNGKINKKEIVKGRVLALACKNKDSCYYASKEGLNFWNGETTRSLKGFKETAPFSRITDLKLQDEVLWIGTNGNGLIKYEEGKFERFHVKKGFPINKCNSIFISPEGVVWVAMNGGIARIEKTDGAYSTSFVGEEDGLPSSIVNAIITINNNLFVATQNGVCVLDLEKIVYQDNYPPSAHIKSVKLLSQDSIIHTNAIIPFQMANIEINFTGFHYASMGKYSFQYRLIGQDTHWTPTSTKSLRFSGLNPGPYVFELLAIDHRGNEGVEKATFTFRVKAPFWRQNIMVVLFFLLLSAIMISIAYFWIRNANKKNKIQLQIQELKHQALRAQMNPHFIFNSMSSIQRFILENKEDQALEYLGEFGALIRQILENSKKTFITLKEEIEFLQLYMDLEQRRLNHKFSPVIEVDPNIKPAQVLIPSLIIQPFLENSIWHGFSGIDYPGKLNLFFGIEGQYLLCVIEDNGIGIEGSKKRRVHKVKIHKSRGMEIIRDRIKVLNNTSPKKISLKISDKENSSGTKVEILFPFD